MVRRAGSWTSSGGPIAVTRASTGFARGGGIGGGMGSSGLAGSGGTSFSRAEGLEASLQEAVQAAAGAAAMNAAPPTEENRELRRQSISRRLSRGISRSASMRRLSPRVSPVSGQESVASLAATTFATATSDAIITGGVTEAGGLDVGEASGRLSPRRSSGSGLRRRSMGDEEHGLGGHVEEMARGSADRRLGSESSVSWCCGSSSCGRWFFEELDSRGMMHERNLLSRV